MARKNINDIVKSELIARTNNARIRQEYADTKDLPIISGKTVFTTVYEIDTIVYVTINGVTQILGVDYLKKGKFEIEFNTGAFADGTMIQVGYMYNKDLSSISGIPEITLFEISETSGGAKTLNFNFNILANDGSDIFWSIIRDGDENKVVASGQALNSLLITVSDEITVEDYVTMPGERVPYTMVLTYNMPSGSAMLNQKVLKSTEYVIDTLEDITGTVKLSKSIVSAAGPYAFTSEYNLLIPSNSLPNYQWKFEQRDIDGTIITLASGTQASVVASASFAISGTASQPQSDNVVFTLYLKPDGGVWEVLGTSTFTIAVAAAALVGYGGWLPSEYFYPTYPDLTDHMNTWAEYAAVSPSTAILDPTSTIKESDINGVTGLKFNIVTTSTDNVYLYLLELPVAATGNADGDVVITTASSTVSSSGYVKFLSPDLKTVVYIITQQDPEAGGGATFTPESGTVMTEYRIAKINK